jgi:hypothetical protein
MVKRTREPRDDFKAILASIAFESIDVDLVAGPAHAAFERVAHAKLAANCFSARLNGKGSIVNVNSGTAFMNYPVIASIPRPSALSWVSR